MSVGKLSYAKAISVESMRNVDKDPLGIRIRDMVQEFEEFQSKQKNRVYVAVRTRQAIVKKGFRKVVEEAVKARPSIGFQTMVNNGLARLTYEWIYLEFHPEVFKNGVMAETARTRLERHGVGNLPGSSPLRKRAKRQEDVETKARASAASVVAATKAVPEKRERGWNLPKKGKKPTVAEAEAKQVKKTRKLKAAADAVA